MFSLYTEEKGIVGSDPEDSCKGDSSCGSSCFLFQQLKLCYLHYDCHAFKTGFSADPCEHSLKTVQFVLAVTEN